jgi:hypothetical protein
MLRAAAKYAVIAGGAGAGTYFLLDQLTDGRTQQSLDADAEPSMLPPTTNYAALRSPSQLPPAMKTTPEWSRPPPGGAGGGGESGDVGLQLSDSFDQQPLDEDDECTICQGDPLARSGQGVVNLECAHRFHRTCVASLRCRLVTSPCPSCNPEHPPPPWETAVRQYAQIEQRVAQGRIQSWDELNEVEKESVATLAELLQTAAAAAASSELVSAPHTHQKTIEKHIHMHHAFTASRELPASF